MNFKRTHPSRVWPSISLNYCEFLSFLMSLTVCCETASVPAVKDLGRGSVTPREAPGCSGWKVPSTTPGRERERETLQGAGYICMSRIYPHTWLQISRARGVHESCWTETKRPTACTLLRSHPPMKLKPDSFESHHFVSF